MWAIIAAILFGVALLLELVGQGALVGVLTLGGLLSLALNFALGTGLPWRRT